MMHSRKTNGWTIPQIMMGLVSKGKLPDLKKMSIFGIDSFDFWGVSCLSCLFCRVKIEFSPPGERIHIPHRNRLNRGGFLGDFPGKYFNKNMSGIGQTKILILDCDILCWVQKNLGDFEQKSQVLKK